MVTRTNTLSLKSQRVTASSLLIPNQLLLYFSLRSSLFGGSKYYFQYLIKTYARHLLQYGYKPIHSKWKNEYQQEGLDLQKRNFKPNPVFWEEFRNISSSYGLAMCKFFTILLELEHERWLDAGCPDDFHEIPPLQSKTNKSGMNSNSNTLQTAKIDLKTLLNSKNCTILIRSIDTYKEKLDRLHFIS